MNKISPSKISLLTVVLSLSFFAGTGIITGEQYLIATGPILAFYFTKSGVKTAQYAPDKTAKAVKSISKDEAKALEDLVKEI